MVYTKALLCAQSMLRLTTTLTPDLFPFKTHARTHAYGRARAHIFRYEYAASSSLMIVAIATLFGCYDLSSLILIFIVNATMNFWGTSLATPLRTPPRALQPWQTLKVVGVVPNEPHGGKAPSIVVRCHSVHTRPLQFHRITLRSATFFIAITLSRPHVPTRTHNRHAPVGTLRSARSGRHGPRFSHPQAW